MKRFKATVTIDRPLGYLDSYGTTYPVNYGFVEGIIAGDGEAQDVYVLLETEKLVSFIGEVIAVVVRKDDVEDKWVAAPTGTILSKEEIAKQIAFIEQYFDSDLILLK
ncbi:inorganic pyrophosphatase [Enterococcus sp. AZ072]|uniref:inorganic pyrophosphatase n=1 Tax=unclassified Enterococcus TaxID=2608891 RepID=UPI003D2BA78B